MKQRVLILGGTTEARQLAQLLADRGGLDVTMSLAGRTAAPLTQPVPVRQGGFGGVAGLAHYLQAQRIDVLIDATHPYAATISSNARQAAAQTGTPIVVLLRPPWMPVAKDNWLQVEALHEAVQALGRRKQHVLLALGRQEIAVFTAAPQHYYLIRSVDAIEPPLDLPHASYLLARGPFAEADERALLVSHSIEVIVAKNSGGGSTYAKIAAARDLGIAVILLRRPPQPPGQCVATAQEALVALDQVLGKRRGV